MITDNMIVTLQGLEQLNQLACGYDAAISPIDPSDDAAIAQAAQQYCSDNPYATVFSSDGARSYKVSVAAPANPGYADGSGDSDGMMTNKSQLTEVQSVVQQLTTNPENIANGLQAKVTSSDGSYQMVFSLVAVSEITRSGV